MSELVDVKRSGVVKFGYDFKTVSEVTQIWHLTAKKLPYRNYFWIPNQKNCTCTLLSQEGGDGWSNIPHRGSKMDKRGFLEIVRIEEFNADVKKSEDRVKEELEKPLVRYVFWREQLNGAKWYKFYGVFRLDVEATKAAMSEGRYVCIYKKVADEVKCPQ